MPTKKPQAPIDWIWIWKPEFYFDTDGKESPHLLPGTRVRCVGTCHPDTEPGQLVVLYRTKPKMDVAYLLRTVSSAMLNEGNRGQGTNSQFNNR